MEKAVNFSCNGNRLYGILHIPDGHDKSNCLVVMVTGGFQPRFGGHRLYLQLARYLCSSNITVFRFDYEGLGDSEGDMVGFQGAGPSIKSAIDYLHKTLPNISVIILWSLCDGCPISIIYGTGHEKNIDGYILCNPFIFFEQGSRELAQLKYYYSRRIFSRQFWKRIFFLNINISAETAIFLNYFKEVIVNKIKSIFDINQSTRLSLEGQVLKGLSDMQNPIYLIFGSKDMGAIEFRNIIREHEQIMYKVSSDSIIIKNIDGADHTFSEPHIKEKLFQITLNAVNKIKHKVLFSFNI